MIDATDMPSKNHPFRLFFSSLYSEGKEGNMAQPSFGERLAHIRGVQKLSQQDVAEMTGLRVQNISRWETDNRQHIRSDTLIRLTPAPQGGRASLLGPTPAPTPPPPPP